MVQLHGELDWLTGWRGSGARKVRRLPLRTPRPLGGGRRPSPDRHPKHLQQHQRTRKQVLPPFRRRASRSRPASGGRSSKCDINSAARPAALRVRAANRSVTVPDVENLHGPINHRVVDAPPGRPPVENAADREDQRPELPVRLDVLRAWFQELGSSPGFRQPHLRSLRVPILQPYP